MASSKLIKFFPITIVFIIGVTIFFYFKKTADLGNAYVIAWIILFLIIQFCGAYFIGFNFHLSSVNSLDTNEKKVLLTFDDGPHSPNTAKVLEVLKKHNVKAVFFLIGKNIPGNEVIVQQLVADRHRIGNHSFSHDNLIDLWSAKKVSKDFAECQALIQNFQAGSVLFRPPYGVTNPNIAKVVKQLGLRSVGWSIRSYDTSLKDVEKIKQRVLSKLKPGAIILLHDRLDLMAELLESLIPAIKEKGYGFADRV